MTWRGNGRARGPDAAGLVASDPAVVGDEVTRLAVALPLDYGELSNITRLLVIDSLNQEHLDAIVQAIVRSALDHPAYETTANRWRVYVPPWVRVGSMSGATATVLKRMGILVATGRYERCAKGSSRNSNKLQPIHVLNLATLRELLARRADGAQPVGTA